MSDDKKVRKNMVFTGKTSTLGFYIGWLDFSGALWAHHVKEDTKMKKTLSMIAVLTMAMGIATHVEAKSERKDAPKKRFVEETLKALGGEHSPAKMKVKKISSVEVGDTYYHIYEGELDKLGFHIIVFDNYQNYLGYYTSDYAPCNNQIEGSIVMDSGDVDEDGETMYYVIPIDPKKGPPGKVSIGGMPSAFVKVALPEGAKTGAPSAGGAQANGKAGAEDAGPVPEYRDWIIMHKGKKIPARAIFVRYELGKVYLKLEANGAESGFNLNMLSREDQTYVKQFK